MREYMSSAGTETSGSNQIYIHYGSKQFDISKFEPIRNWWNKPHGGLWASPVNAVYGWKRWNAESHYRECSEENSFRFTLAPDAVVYCIDSESKALGLPSLPWPFPDIKYPSTRTFDFERVLHAGIDAIELKLSTDRQLYWVMYGWDCDCILILNPDVIIPLDTAAERAANKRAALDWGY